MKHTNSYKKTCCSDDCFRFSDTDEPCWGEVWVASEVYDDEDSWWIHECRGHEGCYEDGETYKPEPK